MPADETRAIDLFATACNLGHTTSCVTLQGFEAVLREQFDTLLLPPPPSSDATLDGVGGSTDEGTPAEPTASLERAIDLVVQFQVAFGDAWTAARAMALVAAAREADQPLLARQVLERFRPQLGELLHAEALADLPQP